MRRLTTSKGGHATAHTQNPPCCGRKNLRGQIMGIKRDQADIWFSKAVRLRDGCCQVCGTTENLQACHVHGRRLRILRWDLANAITMCAAHHRYYTEQPVAWVDFLNELLGESHMDILREKSRGILKTNKEVRAEISRHYRQEVRRKESDPNYQMISWN